ncbi:MAG: hypothetical protein VKJ09_11745 [Leptolyngbya sp.]|nr:hypothetical protein [Leptolyngbya sp.]
MPPQYAKTFYKELAKLPGKMCSMNVIPTPGDCPMARPTQLLSVTLCSALLVPAV